MKLEYFCTMWPLVVDNHVITGVGGDSLDNPSSIVVGAGHSLYAFAFAQAPNGSSSAK